MQKVLQEEEKRCKQKAHAKRGSVFRSLLALLQLYQGIKFISISSFTQKARRVGNDRHSHNATWGYILVYSSKVHLVSIWAYICFNEEPPGRWTFLQKLPLQCLDDTIPLSLCFAVFKTHNHTNHARWGFGIPLETANPAFKMKGHLPSIAKLLSQML